MKIRSGYRLEDQLGRDRDRGYQRAVDRAALGVHSVHALRGRPVLFVRLQFQLYVDALDDEHAVLFFDFACGFSGQPVDGCGNLTRLQRASKGAGQSTGGRGDDVVESGGVGWGGFRRYFVVFGDGAVDSENHRLRFGRQVGAAQGAFFALDAHFRAIDYFSHFATITL